MSTVRITGYQEANKALALPELKQSLYDEGAVLMDKVLVTLHGEEHRVRRLLEMRIFKKDFFNYYSNQVLPPVIDRAVEYYQRQGRADLMEFGPRAMIALTADFAGIDRPLGTDAEVDTLIAILKSLGLAATLGQFSGDREPIKETVRATLRQFDVEFFTPSEARRRDLIDKFKAGSCTEDQLPRDILTVLLRNEDRVDLPRDMILRETAFYFLAGAHTSVHSLTHAMHEIFTWIDRHPEDRERIMTDRLFVQRCVHESMRLHPSSPVVQRRALCPVHLPSGEGAGTDDTVVIDLFEANRQVAVFGDDAGSFNPHRVLPKNQVPYGLTFGVGLHTCLGRELAAGVVPKPETDANEHQFGTVTALALALIAAHARPDPARPAEREANIAREAWASYPILLGA